MRYKLAVIGVGNMARAVITGIRASTVEVDEICLFDKNTEQYSLLPDIGLKYKNADSIASAVERSDCVLLSVKPQNFEDVLKEIATVDEYQNKLYITIAAGITVQSVSDALGGARVVRVLPNLPMTIGMGVSVICKNKHVATDDFKFVCSLFESSGSVLLIDESDMNRIIGVTSSSPAYVFKFINAVYQGALAQGLSEEGLLDAVCDVFIGSASLLKQLSDTPSELISKVASKGGTTEQALLKLNEADVDNAIYQAMLACTKRADELGGNGK